MTLKINVISVRTRADIPS